MAWDTAWVSHRGGIQRKDTRQIDRAACLHLTNAQNQGIMKIETRLEAADSGD